MRQFAAPIRRFAAPIRRFAAPPRSAFTSQSGNLLIASVHFGLEIEFYDFHYLEVYYFEF
jgi:hypothetical protein